MGRGKAWDGAGLEGSGGLRREGQAAAGFQGTQGRRLVSVLSRDCKTQAETERGPAAAKPL